MTRIVFAEYTADEQAIVVQILDRAAALSQKVGVPFDRLSLDMDLSATHASMPLRLADLLAADDFNFAHDVFGILRHINRGTGRLDDHFVPRFCQPAARS
jgi:hypothetical protein